MSREPSPCGSCEDSAVTACVSAGLHNNNNSSTVNNNATTSSSVTGSLSPGAGGHSNSSSSSNACNNNNNNKVTVATQTGHECPDLAFQQDKMTHDPHCYECKVRYRDPKPRDLIMYLHAWKFRVSPLVLFLD